jgi:hypothetical protein
MCSGSSASSYVGNSRYLNFEQGILIPVEITVFLRIILMQYRIGCVFPVLRINIGFENLRYYPIPKAGHHLTVLKFDTFINVTLNSRINSINILKPYSYLLHSRFNIQEKYFLPTLYLCVLFLSRYKQQCLPYIKLLIFITVIKSVYCSVRTGSLNKAVCARL